LSSQKARFAIADITITPGSVVPVAGYISENGTAGATITAGQVVYLDSSDSKYKLADSNSATAAVRAAYGIALHGGSNGQPMQILRSGDITIGATVAVGTVYVLSATPGGIAPAAPGVTDLVTGMYTFVIGIGQTAAILTVKFFTASVAVP
jgi:hypothetical protein